MDIEKGSLLANRYRVTGPIGRGGMGEVFAAENIRTGRAVAVKVLRPEAKSKDSAVERFRREARAAGSINSDHVTQVLDVEEDPEVGILLVFELLEGESLIDRLKRAGPMTFHDLFPLIEQVLLGIADAHKAGIIHRDLKPSNVFLERRPDGKVRVKVLDFGISKLPKEMVGATLTEMGQSLGTFSFMPPEQVGKAKTVDHRADIYATGTMIFQSLTGQLPFQAKNVLLLVEAKTTQPPRKLNEVSRIGFDPRLEAFVDKCLARLPDDRFQSASECLEAWRVLSAALAPQPSSPASVHAPSVHAPSVHAPSVHAPSVHAPSVHAPSVHAPSVPPLQAGSVPVPRRAGGTLAMSDNPFAQASHTQPPLSTSDLATTAKMAPRLLPPEPSAAVGLGPRRLAPTAPSPGMHPPAPSAAAAAADSPDSERSATLLYRGADAAPKIDLGGTAHMDPNERGADPIAAIRPAGSSSLPNQRALTREAPAQPPHAHAPAPPPPAFSASAPMGAASPSSPPRMGFGALLLLGLLLAGLGFGAVAAAIRFFR